MVSRPDNHDNQLAAPVQVDRTVAPLEATVAPAEATAEGTLAVVDDQPAAAAAPTATSPSPNQEAADQPSQETSQDCNEYDNRAPTEVLEQDQTDWCFPDWCLRCQQWGHHARSCETLGMTQFINFLNRTDPQDLPGPGETCWRCKKPGPAGEHFASRCRHRSPTQRLENYEQTP